MAHQQGSSQPAASSVPGQSAALPSTAAPLATFQQAETLTLEWRVTGVGKLFEGSKGDTKSRVSKSVLFGGGKWQILFYPNAGGTASEYCSLYLSCEPSPDEYEDASSWPAQSSGKWARHGTYSFRFLVCSSDGKTVCSKEASSHTFTNKTANWGWAQYGKRDGVFFNNAVTRASDVFTIHCSISSSAAPPIPPPSAPMQLVPKDLLGVMGRLLNDRAYSDVEFFIAKRGGGGTSIWANKLLLSRAEYFETMLRSGFAEDLDQGGLIRDDESMASMLAHEPDDSDAEDDYDSAQAMGEGTDGEDEEDEKGEEESGASEDEEDGASSLGGAGMQSGDGGGRDEESVADIDEEGTPPAARKVKLPKVSKARHDDDSTISRKSSQAKLPKEAVDQDGPKRTRIVVRDASYPTFYALLFYLYTDSIHFAPLTSSFVSQSTPFSPSQSLSIASSIQSTSGNSFSPAALSQSSSGLGTPARARRAWIAAWSRNHPNLPGLAPVSSKSIYCLAEKMGLYDLKKKAFDHIVSQLSVTNIPYEAFSSFSATFDEVRKVQVEFFLKNWVEIKKTDGMRDIWGALRSGRHAGFDTVWPLILSQLEYVPQTDKETTATAGSE